MAMAGSLRGYGKSYGIGDRGIVGMRGALVLEIMNDIKQKKKIDNSDAQTKRKRAANKYSKLTDLEIEAKIRELEQRNEELEAENMALKKSIRSIKF